MLRDMSGFWRKCRIIFRWLRITFRWVRFAVWFLALTALSCLIWFNQVGLPGFLKSRLTATLEQRGVRLEFSRMRLHFVHGLILEGVRLGGNRIPGRLAVSAGELQLRLNYAAMLKGRCELLSVVLRNGALDLPLSASNALTLSNLETELRFESDDLWALDHFRAKAAGVYLSLSGEIAHPREVAGWNLFSGVPNADPGAAARSLSDFSGVLARLRFAGQPQLNVTFSGDAHDIHSFVVRLNANADAVKSPWFSARHLQAAAQLTLPADAILGGEMATGGFWSNAQPFRLAWSLRLTDWKSPKLTAEKVRCEGHWRAPELAVTVLQAQLPGGSLDASARLNVATRELAFTNASAFDLQAAWLPEPLRRRLASVTWARPPQIRVAGAVTLPPWTTPQSSSFDWAASLRLQGELAVTNLTVAGTCLEAIRTHFSCTNQIWSLPDLQLQQGKTRLTLSGNASTATKDFRVRLEGALASASVRPFLAETQATKVFQILTFHQPLALDMTAWGNGSDFRQAAVTGRLALADFALQGEAIQPLTADLALGSNRVQMQLVQGKTRLQVTGERRAATEDFCVRVAGQLDAQSVRPFLMDSNAVRGFEFLTFHEPLALDLTACGRGNEWERLAATGHLALTNCAIRGQTVDQLTADVVYTNWTAEFLNPQLSRAGGDEHFSAEKVTLDLAGQRLFLTGGMAHVTPMVVGRAIGPKTAKAMEPYQFLSIPDARVSGCVPLRKSPDGEIIMDDADLHVKIVAPAPFHWRRFTTPTITGSVVWRNTDLILTNAVMNCYGGEARGWAVFDVRPEGVGTDFRFFITGSNVDLHEMGKSLWSATNQLEGAVSGSVMVTQANSEDWRSWQGFGSARLRDGLLWDVPIFGLISPAVNVLTPGWGNNRATQAVGDFTMTNGVIFTDGLVIHTAMMRLDYVGTVDLEERVHARVTAQILRNTPLLGSVVSVLLWPVSKVFEYEVKGTLENPNPTPVHAPAKLLLAPLHPFRTLEDLFSAPAEPKSPPAAPPKE